MGWSKMDGNTAMKGWIENEARELFSWAWAARKYVNERVDRGLFSWTWAARKWPEIRVDRERGKGIIQLDMGCSKMAGNTGG
jgi:hypothetical protein